MKLLLLDIETAPKVAYVWGLFRQNIGINQIISPGRTICWAAKWVGAKDTMFRSEYHHGHSTMVEDIHELLTEADGIITYNGRSFDLPTLYREFVLRELAPPAPHDDIDLLSVVRSQFRFDSNKLDWVAQQLGVGAKVQHKGMDLWTGCMNNDPDDWATMKQYNIQDVEMMEPLYHKLLPWIKKHPNWGVFKKAADMPMCTKCGSTDLQARGTRKRAAGAYKRYQCNDCGSWLQGRFMEKEYRGNHNVLKPCS